MYFGAISLRFYLTVLLAVISVIGDYITSVSDIPIFRAVFDNVTHTLIGGLSWFLVCIYSKRYNYGVLIEVFLCSILASLIDLDHFLMAKSLRLKDATNLKGRPPLHCSTFVLAFCFFFLILRYVIKSDFVVRGCLIILTAFASHHTRDATRRGYWFYPFGSTPSIPYVAYIAITCYLPYVVYRVYDYFNTSQSHTIDGTSLV